MLSSIFRFLAELMSFLNRKDQKRDEKLKDPVYKQEQLMKDVNNEILKDDEAAANVNLNRTLNAIRMRNKTSNNNRS